MMIKITHLLLAGAVVFGLCNMVQAQDPSPSQPAAGTTAGPGSTTGTVPVQGSLPAALPASPESGVRSGVLEALPRPRDTPSSLFAAPGPPSPGGIPIGGPYFTPDPLLDPSFFPSPGWFVGAEAQIVKPHLINDYKNSVFPGRAIQDQSGLYPLGPKANTVDLPAGSLDWTAGARVFLGYRLPSGFGEFMVAYRHLASSGSSSVPDTNGPIGLNTRFAFEMLDIDYNSRELSLQPNWDMKWTLGLRNMWLFSDTQGTQPSAQAAGGSGIAFAQQSNSIYGIGPHSALELNRRLGDSGWSILLRTDFGALFSNVYEQWNLQSTTVGHNGRPLAGQTNAFGHQFIPQITARAGLTWKPAPTSATRLFVGYQGEVFWDLNRLPQSNGTPYAPPSLGQYMSQGIILQATFNW
jgi:hypothetical protein